MWTEIDGFRFQFLKSINAVIHVVEQLRELPLTPFLCLFDYSDCGGISSYWYYQYQQNSLNCSHTEVTYHIVQLVNTEQVNIQADPFMEERMCHAGL